MHRLFVYGTLRHPPIIEALVGRPLAATPARLAAHRAARIRGRDYPGLVTDPSAHVAGAVVEVDDAQLGVLDRFEGAEYTRIEVTASTATGAVHAQAYLLTGSSRSLATDDTWELDEFVADAAARWVGSAQPGDHHPG